uniref:B30.2/SPRY domain-containing protein n=1 Tax=Globodera rostochiensis TaxID=31243 RepID=A0A914I257_GLORO
MASSGDERKEKFSESNFPKCVGEQLTGARADADTDRTVEQGEPVESPSCTPLLQALQQPCPRPDQPHRGVPPRSSEPPPERNTGTPAFPENTLGAPTSPRNNRHIQSQRLKPASKMRFFHFLDAVCLFVVAAFILLETDAQPKKSTSNTILENEPAEQKNPGLTLKNQWNPDADSCHADLTLSMPVQLSDPKQPSDSKLSKFKEWVVNHNKKKSKLTQRNSDANAHHPPHLTLSEPVQPSDSKLSKSKGLLVVKHINNGSTKCCNVFAEQPIPKTSAGTFYYEVSILGKADFSFIFFGLCPKRMPLHIKIGHFKGSYVYQSGGVFVADSVPMKVDSNGIKIPRIRAGNVVGCGVDFENHNELFYTLNGKRMGTAGELVDSDDELFPCVSLFTFGDEIEANFGPKFNPYRTAVRDHRAAEPWSTIYPSATERGPAAGANAGLDLLEPDGGDRHPRIPPSTPKATGRREWTGSSPHEDLRGNVNPGDEQRALTMVGQRLPAHLMMCQMIAGAEGRESNLAPPPHYASVAKFGKGKFDNKRSTDGSLKKKLNS